LDPRGGLRLFSLEIAGKEEGELLRSFYLGRRERKDILKKKKKKEKHHSVEGSRKDLLILLEKVTKYGRKGRSLSSQGGKKTVDEIERGVI